MELSSRQYNRDENVLAGAFFKMIIDAIAYDGDNRGGGRKSLKWNILDRACGHARALP